MYQIGTVNIKARSFSRYRFHISSIVRNENLTFKNPVLTIRYSQFAPFSDMSMGHRISLVGFSLLQNSKGWLRVISYYLIKKIQSLDI
jgi:hypothetical protein